MKLTAMDLIALTKKAIYKPLRPQHFFVLFVTGFIILIIGLSILGTTSLFLRETKAKNCDVEARQPISGEVSKSKDKVYLINFEGGAQCLLEAVFDWNNSNNESSIWVYDPDGKIEVIEPNSDDKISQITKTSPLQHGLWRFVVKNKSDQSVSFSGNISLK